MTKQLRVYIYLLMSVVNIGLCIVIILLASIREPKTIGQVLILSDIAKESTIEGQPRTLVKGIIKMKEKEETNVEPANSYQTLIDTFSAEEKKMLYQVTFAESGNQSIKGQRAVMESILNRMLHKDFPNSLEEVLSQKGQFSTWPACKKGEYNSNQELALSLVYSESPILPSYKYVYFGTDKHSYGKDYLEIEDHWFGRK